MEKDLIDAIMDLRNDRRNLPLLELDRPKNADCEEGEGDSWLPMIMVDDRNDDKDGNANDESIKVSRIVRTKEADDVTVTVTRL